MAIIPQITDLTRPYWAAARAGRLVVQRCEACGQAWHPPLPRCPHCHSASVGWQEVAGTGTVYTYTVVTHPTHVALAGMVPYVVAIVELDEGPRVVTGITGCAPPDVRAGMRVRVCFEPVTDDVSLPYFYPRGDDPPVDPPAKGGDPLSPPSQGNRQTPPAPGPPHLPAGDNPLKVGE